MDLAGIKCPVHTSELIQRVDIHPHSKQSLFCLECITQSEDPNNLFRSLQALPDFLQTAISFYDHNRTSNTPGEPTETPGEYSELLSTQADAVEKLTKQIENEKKKIESLADQTLALVTQRIQEKKNEYINLLDEQLTNLTGMYSSLEKQIRRNYPSPEDVDYLFPSKQELEKRFTQISNAVELRSFVESIKEDMSQVEILASLENRPDQKKKYFDSMAQRLKEVSYLKPTVDIRTHALQNMKNDLRSAIDKVFKESVQIKDELPARLFGPISNSSINAIKKVSPRILVDKKVIKLACSESGQLGWGLVYPGPDKKDRRDQKSVYAYVLKGTKFEKQSVAFVKIGPFYKIVVAEDGINAFLILTCHGYYKVDKRDSNSARAFLHDAQDKGQLWDIRQEGDHFRIVLADSNCEEKGWYLSAARDYDSDIRDGSSTYLFVNRNKSVGQLWDIE